MFILFKYPRFWYVNMQDALKPEQTLLLLSLFRKSGIGRPFKGKISAIAKDNHTSLNTVVALLKWLDRYGYLQIDESYRLRGKGERSYVFTENMWNMFCHNEFFKWVIEDQSLAVDSLFTDNLPVVFSQGDKDRKTFRGGNRLFLLIFLWRMTDLGVVEISSAEVCRLMGGISRSRFKSMLRKLGEIKLFRLVIPGTTARTLFGKTKSRYFIDLKHPLFGQRQNGASSVAINLSLLLEGNEETEATRLIAYSSLMEPLPETYPYPLSEVNFQLIRTLFQQSSLHDQLQLLLCEIASELLSSNWQSLEPPLTSERLEELCSWERLMPKLTEQELSNHEDGDIRRTIYFNVLSTFIHLDCEADEQCAMSDALRRYQELLRLLLLLSTAIARKFKSILMLANGNDFSAGQVTILPLAKYQKPETYYEVRYLSHGLRKDTEITFDTHGVIVKGVGGVAKPVLQLDLTRHLDNIFSGRKVVQFGLSQEQRTKE